MICQLCSWQLRIKMTISYVVIKIDLEDHFGAACPILFLITLKYRVWKWIVLQDCAAKFPSRGDNCLRDQKSKPKFLQVEEYVNQTIGKMWKILEEFWQTRTPGTFLILFCQHCNTVSADGGTSLRNRSGLFIQIKENNFTVKLSNSTGKSSLITALMIPKIAQ